MDTQHKEIKWVNFAKFIAILAVIIDHSEMILYENTSVAMATYFSVSLFIFISGMMSYKSCLRHNFGYAKTVFRSLKRIVPAYLLAVFIYQIVTIGFWDFLTYITFVINFNICGHFYYVALYVQLMLSGWVLYRIINNIPKKYTIPAEILLGGIILLICSFTTLHTNVMYIYGGGGKLFGGTFLFIFYLGMVAEKHDIFRQISTKKNAAVFAISSMCTVVWWRFECRNWYGIDKRLPFGEGINPPSITTFIMMIFVILTCYSAVGLFQNIKGVNKVIDVFSLIGKHTLYIFLYHRLILDQLLVPFVSLNNIWVKRVIYVLSMIAAPIAIETVKNIFVSYISLKSMNESNDHD